MSANLATFLSKRHIKRLKQLLIGWTRFGLHERLVPASIRACFSLSPDRRLAYQHDTANFHAVEN